MKGKKLGQTIVLDSEPAIPDGTEVDVVLPDDWEAEKAALLGIGYYPDFGKDIEQAQAAWKPEEF